MTTSSTMYYVVANVLSLSHKIGKITSPLQDLINKQHSLRTHIIKRDIYGFPKTSTKQGKRENFLYINV